VLIKMRGMDFFVSARRASNCRGGGTCGRQGGFVASRWQHLGGGRERKKLGWSADFRTEAGSRGVALCVEVVRPARVEAIFSGWVGRVRAFQT